MFSARLPTVTCNLPGRSETLESESRQALLSEGHGTAKREFTEGKSPQVNPQLVEHRTPACNMDCVELNPFWIADSKALSKCLFILLKMYFISIPLF
jgi:hypothetical protein